jgi:hypothetical protein
MAGLAAKQSGEFPKDTRAPTDLQAANAEGFECRDAIGIHTPSSKVLAANYALN